MMSKLAPSGETWTYVHVEVDDHPAPILAGKLVLDSEKGECIFQYAGSYCMNPTSPALDPINIPKIKGSKFRWPITRSHSGVPDSITDSGATDGFSKRAVRAMQFALHPESLPKTDIDYLLLSSTEGVGNVFCSQERQLKSRVPLTRRPFGNTEEIMETALLIDEGEEINEAQAIFFKDGSGAGGERPKTQLTEEGRTYIAKFPRSSDSFNNTLSEYLCMNMARDAGIETANTKLVSTVMGDVLLVERFDICGEQKRKHLISAKSLTNIYSIDNLSVELFSYASIVRMAEQIKSGSNQESKVSREVYRRMLFNVCCGNTDDHMRNHAFIDGEISPAFDINSSDRHGGHSISISENLGTFPTLESLSLAAKEMGIDENDALEIAADVLAATEGWEEKYRKAGMSAKDITVLSGCFQQRSKVKALYDQLSTQEKKRARSAGLNVST